MMNFHSKKSNNNNNLTPEQLSIYTPSSKEAFSTLKISDNYSSYQ